MAKRMGATTVELDSSHVPMLSQPDLVLDVTARPLTPNSYVRCQVWRGRVG